MIRKLLFLLLFFIIAGCWSVPKHLITVYGEYQHSDYSKLNINGYFYKVDSIDNQGNSFDYPRIKWFMLYEDGTLLQSFQTVREFKGLKEFEEAVFNHPADYYDFHQFSDKKNTWWGAYSIEDSTITFQYFVCYDQWVAVERKAEIINSEQIAMFYSNSLNGYHKNGDTESSGEYTFKEFDNKPDSLNWMKVDKYYLKKTQK